MIAAGEAAATGSRPEDSELARRGFSVSNYAANSDSSVREAKDSEGRWAPSLLEILLPPGSELKRALLGGGLDSSKGTDRPPEQAAFRRHMAEASQSMQRLCVPRKRQQ